MHTLATLMPMRDVARFLVMAAMAAWLCACDAPRRVTGTAQPGEWLYWPAAMRIHPLTRLVAGKTEGTVVLETRVEFLDVDGHSTKACGDFRLDLILGPGATIDLTSPSWELNLGDREVNRQQFDDITRTYLFRLEIPATQLPRGSVLKAYYYGLDGSQLDATYELK